MSRFENIEHKIIELQDLTRMVRGWQTKGLKVVFTNGVFDIVHRGHVTLLAQAAAHGHKLVVGINADASVRSLGKGANRPINDESDRAMVVAAMQCVDAVVVFNDSTPMSLIETLCPDVLVKGGDYNPEQQNPQAKDYLVGAAFQKLQDKQTVVIPLVDGYSTTLIIQKSTGGQI
jgi:D-beta-D-heptose 7-phosphate kinase/D-beta-D-heptose 1-phosphate adenosyltransferase